MTARGNRQRSVNDRIRLAAAAQGVDANRLRRSLVFHRVLARLAPDGFVLKGGFCLEVRLPGSARATKDVDLVGRVATTTDPEQLLNDLDELFDGGADEDGFTFQPTRPVRLRDEGAANHAWRIGSTPSRTSPKTYASRRNGSSSGSLIVPWQASASSRNFSTARRYRMVVLSPDLHTRITVPMP